RRRGNVVRGAAPAAGPHRVVRVSLLELDPDAGVVVRHVPETHVRADERRRRLGPDAGRVPQDVGHRHQQPAEPLGVQVAGDRPGVPAVEFLPAVAAHGITTGVWEMSPSRASVKLCLYSPRLMSWVTLLT